MKDKTLEDKIKKAVADEFKYRASQGRTNYSMEEVIYIVSEVIDEVFKWEALNGVGYRINGEKSDVDTSSDSAGCENGAISQDHLRDLDIQMCVIKGDLKCLTEKVNKLSSLIDVDRGRK